MSALAMSAITALVTSGVVILASSHEWRQSEESDYAMAMQLAEAGVNYELNYISSNNSLCTTSSQNLPGRVGSFAVSATNADGTTWTAGKPALITATGTVGNMTRKISVLGASTGITLFSMNGQTNAGYTTSYSVFGEQSVVLSGSSYAASGNIGTDGTMTLSGSADDTGTGLVVKAGSSATWSLNSGIAVSRQDTLPNAVVWPTIDTIVAAMIPGGWTTLESTSSVAAESAKIRCFVGTTSTTLSPSNTMSASWPSSGAAAHLLTSTYIGAYNQKTVILTPGNYWFNDFALSSGYNVIFDTQNLSTGGTPGQINLWITGNSTNDSISGGTQIPSGDPTMVRIYWDKAATFTLSGGSGFTGGIYAIRAGSSTSVSPATVVLSGGSTATLSIISDIVSLTGGSSVQEAQNSGTGGISSGSDYSNGGNQYAFSGTWQELAATGGAVFADGTSN